MKAVEERFSVTEAEVPEEPVETAGVALLPAGYPYMWSIDHF